VQGVGFAEGAIALLDRIPHLLHLSRAASQM
jgi:hypothetical protein